MTTFESFKLLPTLQSALDEKKFSTPTEIQLRTIPLLLKGRSVVGVSETGSGKTLAYALPVLHLIKSLEINGDEVVAERSPRAVVVVPTRELGEQVSRVFKPFTHSTRLRVRTVLGGTTMAVAKRNVVGKFDILVATPGRMLQLMQQSLIKLNDLRILVFDEADQMLDQGFLNDAKSIVTACPPTRQMILFSATVSDSVQALVSELFTTADVIRSKGSHRLVSTLTTQNRKIADGKRFPVLEKLLNNKIEGGTLIFTNTRDQCDKVSEELKAKGFTCAIYRGEMDKVERRSNLKAFREGAVELLISTDLASRGLDVDHVRRVVNYHLPQQVENYLHRVGRTARAGREGLVVNFVTERDAPLMRQLETFHLPSTPKRTDKERFTKNSSVRF